MFGNRKKRRVTRIDTLIAQDSEIQGDIRFTGGLHIDGTIKGNVIAENDGSSMLSLSECGTIEGEVTVPYVILNGAVMGDVHSSEHVELASMTRVTGNVYYNLLEMSIGAEVNGKLVHSHEAAESPLAIGHGEPLEASE
jgi:cytoskeletal protein CcmA (bactofilin family)|tara:strand:- start:238 stop:654 length:417 start_codon:yes stop_codon:yes gene_type:complete